MDQAAFAPRSRKGVGAKGGWEEENREERRVAKINR